MLYLDINNFNSKGIQPYIYIFFFYMLSPLKKLYKKGSLEYVKFPLLLKNCVKVFYKLFKINGKSYYHVSHNFSFFIVKKKKKMKLLLSKQSGLLTTILHRIQQPFFRRRSASQRSKGFNNEGSSRCKNKTIH